MANRIYLKFTKNINFAFIYLLLFTFQSLLLQKSFGTQSSYRYLENCGNYAAVSTGHPEATKAAIKILKRGGNAIDAAVAAAFVLSVVDPSNSGLGGDGHALICLPNGDIYAVDGASPPPVKNNKKICNYYKIGLPTEVALLCYIHKKWGSKDLSEVLAPAIKLAQNGFQISSYLHKLLEQNISDIKEDLFIKTYTANSRLIQSGEITNNIPLAQTLKAIALFGPDAFYKGELSKTILSELHSYGSFYDLQQIESYSPKIYKPIQIQINNWKIVGLGVPTSSIVVMALVKKLVEESLPDFSSKENFLKTLFYIASALKLKKQYLASVYNNPYKFIKIFNNFTIQKFSKFPYSYSSLSLLLSSNDKINSKNFSFISSSDFKNDVSQNWIDEFDSAKENTTHLVVCDKNGYAITITLTLGKHFGSRKYSSLGFFYNDQGDNFYPKNALYPSKYPSSYGPITAKSPIILFKNNKPILFIGGAGANQIIINLALIISSYIQGKNDIKSLIHAPRFGFDSKGNVLLEWHSDYKILEKITSWISEVASYTILPSGHDKFGLISAVEITNKDKFLAVSDFRRTGSAYALNENPLKKTNWLLDLIIYSYKGFNEISTAEIIPSPRQNATGWKIVGRNLFIDTSKPTLRSKLLLPSIQNIKFSAVSLRQNVIIDPTATHSSPLPYENPSYWQSDVNLTQTEMEFYNSLPKSFTSDEQFIKWLMLKIAFDFPYKRIKGIMTSNDLLKKGIGDCSGKARLFEKMCKMKKIPTRLVGGVILKEGLLQSTHIWNEVYLNNKWITVCPTNVVYGKLPPNWLVMRYGDVATLETPGKFFIKAKKINKDKINKDLEIDDE